MTKRHLLSFTTTSLVAIAITLTACNKDDGAADSASSNANAGAIQSVDKAMASIGSGIGIAGYISPMGGVASTYCNANGGPTTSGSSDITSASNDYASAVGFCQASFNSQSPDTPRGALYIAGAVSCVAGRTGLFDNLTDGGSNSATQDITIDSNCFGTDAQVSAMISDVGGSTISGVTVTVTDLAASHTYDYQMTFALPSQGTSTVYIKNSDGIVAAMMSETGSTWAVVMDSSAGTSTTIHYEGIMYSNNRRMRINIQGVLGTAGTFTSVSSIKGFWMQGSGSGYSNHVTFTGNLTDGMKGNSYPNGGSDTVDNCYLPGGSATCSGLTSISSSQADGGNQYSALSTAATNLANYSSLISTNTMDPSDTDITQ